MIVRTYTTENWARQSDIMLAKYFDFDFLSINGMPPDCILFNITHVCVCNWSSYGSLHSCNLSPLTVIARAVCRGRIVTSTSRSVGESSLFVATLVVSTNESFPAFCFRVVRSGNKKFHDIVQKAVFVLVKKRKLLQPEVSSSHCTQGHFMCVTALRCSALWASC